MPLEMTKGLGFRAIWEPFNVELEEDVDLARSGSGYEDYGCPHVRDGKVPRVVVAYNEAGYDSVGICADCLIEALQKLKDSKVEGGLSVNIESYVGKRCLLTVRGAKFCGESIDEYRILELSPSGHWVKLQNLHGNKFWRAVTEVSFVEELRDFKAERRELGDA